MSYEDGRSDYTPGFQGKLAMKVSPTLPSGSQQDAKDGLPDLATPEGYVWPPLPLHGLSHLSTQNSIRRSIIEAIVRNTVGLGWSVRPAPRRPEIPKPKEVEVKVPPMASPVTGATPPGQPDAPAAAPTGSPNTGHAAAKPDPTGKVAGAPPAATPGPADGAGQDPTAEPGEEGPKMETVEPSPEAIEAAKLAQRAWDAERLLDRLAAKDYVADSPSFLGLLCLVKTDEEECGNGAIEISRNKVTAEIDGLYYAPGNRVRRDYARRGYCIVPEHDEADQERIRYFRPFGEGVEVDDDGKLVGWEEGFTGQGMNELLVFRLMTSESRDYGLPRDTSLLEDYLADHRAAETNTAFFANGGVPPTIVFVSVDPTENGEEVVVEVPRDVAKDVANTLRPGKDGFAPRVAVLPLPPGGKAIKVDLGTQADKDIGFNIFRGSVIQRQLSTFRLQPIFIATTNVGGASQTTDAEVQRSMTLEQLFDPEQGRYERILSTRLLPQLGYDDLEIAFTRMAVEGDAARREAAKTAADVGAVTNREFRDAHGFEELPEDGDAIEAGWNEQLVKGKAAKAPDQSTPTPEVLEGEDQRGQRPGVGGRSPAGTENPDAPRDILKAVDYVEHAAAVTGQSIIDLHRARLDAIPAE